MRHNWVHEASEKGRIYEIGNELGSLGDRATGYSSSGYSESPLVQEGAVIKGGSWEGFEAKKMVADEAVWGGPKSEGKAEEVIEDTTGGGVEDVGEHDVHGVFGSDGAGAEHGEAELHGEDEVGGEEEIGGVYGVGSVGEFVGDVGELFAKVGCGCGRVGGVGPKELGKSIRWAGEWRRHGWETEWWEERERERESRVE